MKKKFSSLFHNWWPLLGIVAAALVFFYPVWLRGYVPLPADFVVGVYYPWLDYKWGFAAGVPVKNPLTTDVVSFTYPMQTFAVELMKKGQWPLWNPLILAGTPLLANFQSAPFSPTNFVYFLFDSLTAWSLQIILQHIIAASFTYILLRHWRISKVGSLFGGIIFAFSGFNLIWSQWNGHALSAAFIPLILFFEDRWLRDGRWRDGTGVAVALALQLLSGYPQVVFYTLAAMGVLWIVRIWNIKVRLFKTALLGIFTGLSLGLAAFQVLPGAELLSLSQRGVEPHPYNWAFLPWVKTITFLAPDYFGNHATQNYWGPQDYTSNTGFVGVVAFVLASLSVWISKKKKGWSFALLLLFFSLILSYPTPLSITIWKSGIFGLQAASAHRALVLFNLAVAVLAGFGVDYLLKTKNLRFRKALIFPYLVIGGFGVATLYLYFTTRDNPELFYDRWIPKYVVGLRNLALPTAALLFTTFVLFLSSKLSKLRKVLLSGLFVVLLFELFRFGWKFTPFSPRHIVFPKTPVLEFLTSQKKPFRVTGNQVIPINMRMPYYLESLEGYDAVYPLRIAQFIAALNSRRSGTDPQGRYATVNHETSHLLDLVNTRYYLVLKRDEKKNPSPQGKIPSHFDKERFRLVFENKSVAVLESRSALPRAFMVYDWEKAEGDRESLDRLLDKDFPIGEKILVEGEVSIARGGQGKAEVAYQKYAEQESIIKVTSTKEGLLFISDAWFPGWKAYVDGEEVKIYRANYAFRAIVLPAGEHSVRFVYAPDSFFNGFKVSAASLLLLLGLSPALSFLGKRRRRGYTKATRR